MTTVTKPGVYPTMPKRVYDADPCPAPSVRSSILGALGRSPLHAWTISPGLNPEYVEPDAEERFDLGTAFHEVVLEGEDRVVTFDVESWSKKADREERDKARLQGCIPMKERDYARVQVMRHAYDIQAPQLAAGEGIDLARAKAEVSMIWTEEIGGTTIWCRMRPDLVCTDDVLVDLKTSVTASPIAWANRICWSTGAMIQAAFNRRGYKALTGREPRFFDLVIETSPPHGMGIFAQDPETAEIMDNEVERLLHLWAQCIRENRWPAYPAKTTWISPPGWLLAQELRGDKDALQQFARARNKNVLDLMVEMQGPTEDR